MEQRHKLETLPASRFKLFFEQRPTTSIFHRWAAMYSPIEHHIFHNWARWPPKQFVCCHSNPISSLMWSFSLFLHPGPCVYIRDEEQIATQKLSGTLHFDLFPIVRLLASNRLLALWLLHLSSHHLEKGNFNGIQTCKVLLGGPSRLSVWGQHSIPLSASTGRNWFSRTQVGPRMLQP